MKTSTAIYISIALIVVVLIVFLVLNRKRQDPVNQQQQQSFTPNTQGLSLLAGLFGAAVNEAQSGGWGGSNNGNGWIGTGDARNWWNSLWAPGVPGRTLGQ